MNNGEQQTLLMVDDNPIVREGILIALEDENYDIREAGNGKEALRILKENHKDVVILDLRMPVCCGRRMIIELMESEVIQTKIILYTVAIEAYNVAAMFKVGVDGFLDKRCGRQEIIDACKAVKNGNKYYSKRVNEVLTNEANLLINNWPTVREMEVLIHTALGKTAADIGRELFIATSTVNDYKSSLARKLGVDRRRELLTRSRSLGLLEIQECECKKCTELDVLKFYHGVK